MSNDWEKLDISRAEVDRIEEAFKDEKFRKMFVEYCQEISDPENRKLYESEIKQLEAERGVDITFINPEPGYVIKTSADGMTKSFINIATSDKIEKPSSVPSTNADGTRGLNWNLPYTLSPPRRDFDKKNAICMVYDVVFHPDALHLASRNISFKNLVNDTAIDAVKCIYHVNLDRINMKFPKISYKGIAKSTVIRKKIDGFDMKAMEPSVIDSIYPPLPNENKVHFMQPAAAPPKNFTIPKYKLVQRRGIDLLELTHDIDAKLNVAIPSELVVTINLPLINTTKDVNLDVTSNRVHLSSEKPAKYKLDISLPYDVLEENGTAMFDKTKRQLIVNLPVRPVKKNRNSDFQREDSGIESDQQIANEKFEDSPAMDLRDRDEINLVENLEGRVTMKTEKGAMFLDKNIDYVLPNFTFNHIDEILAFTLHVKNVEPQSIVIDRKDHLNLAHIKFSSIGSGFFPIYYSFCVKLLSQNIRIFRDVTAEAWDNNLIFQFELNNYDFHSYEAGLTDGKLLHYDISEKLISSNPLSPYEKDIEGDSLSIEVRSDAVDELVIEVNKKDSKIEDAKSRHETSNDEKSEDVFDDSVCDNTKRQTRRKRGNKKIRSMSESFCDQLKVINELDQLKLDSKEEKIRKNKQRSISESSEDERSLGDAKDKNHHQYKSILKNRNYFSECNESSIDDHHIYSISADFGICQSQDSLSESCKKTVRFNENIKRQLFRSNTSILAQKKKNQKKKANRKRAIDRRHHSEGSESEKHEDDEKEEDDVGSFEHVSFDIKEQKRDSGVDLCEKHPKNGKTKHVKSNCEKINKTDLSFKSNMIFDLEM